MESRCTPGAQDGPAVGVPSRQDGDADGIATARLRVGCCSREQGRVGSPAGRAWRYGRSHDGRPHWLGRSRSRRPTWPWPLTGGFDRWTERRAPQRSQPRRQCRQRRNDCPSRASEGLLWRGAQAHFDANRRGPARSRCVAAFSYCSGRSAGPPVVPRSFPWLGERREAVTVRGGERGHWAMGPADGT